jgi:hypothetical protein
MSEIHWETLFEAFDRIEAEIIKEALEAQGIPAALFQEGAMHYAYAGGTVEVCVPNERLEEAQAWLEEYQAGEIEEIRPDDENAEESE